MKKILAWVLVLVMVLGMFAGCKKDEPAPTEPAGEVITAQDAIEYLKALYPKTEEALKTPVNYDRMGIIRIGGIPFTVVWTTDLPEEQIKVIVSEDGATVTMDVNEQCEADTPYVLTATITDEQGNTASTTWDCVLPQAVDMVALVKEAYALKAGESLPYEATLRGKIVSIDTVWNPEYQNITVTIAVEGAEDMPIQCYRLKGEGAETLAVGNIITVTGTLKNYNGTIEFDAGCMLDAVEQGDAVVAPTDPGEILKAAYKLKKGKSLPYPVTLTGKVTSIDKPFDPAYNNISVVITVDGYKKYPILCYRLKGSGVEDIALEDTITVTGIIKNYNGTIEFDAGCQMTDRISGGNTAQKPTDDEDKILKDAKKLKEGEKLPYIAILTGQVFSVDEKYNSEYKNVTVTMKVGGMRIKCYRLKGDGVNKIKVGDTITVSGQIENYNGIIEYGNGCTMTDRKAGNGKLKVELGPVDESKTYYAEMKQAKLYANLYLNGQISSSGYLKTTEDPTQAVQIHVEEVSGKGTRFYFLNGETKTYIEIHESGDKQRPALVTEPTAYWNYDSEYKVYFMDVDGIYCALGTYNDYDTVSATKLGFLSTSNIGKSQFVVKYVTEPSAAPEKPETPELGVIYTDAPVVGTAYKFVLDQAGLGQQLGFTGKMSGYYYGTSEEIAQMVDVYLEEATGGYHIYFMNGNTKTYLNVIPRDNDPTKTNVVMQTKAQNAAPSVYELNTEHKYVKTAAAGDEWYLGTYGTNKTISASQTYRIEDPSVIGATQFVAWFATIGEVTPEQPPVTPDEPEQPGDEVTMVTAPVAGTAYKMYLVQATKGQTLFFNGATESASVNYRLALVEDKAQAVDVYLEEATGGYRLYFMNGTTKTYIRVYERDAANKKGSLEFVTTAPAEVMTFDSTYNTLKYTSAGGENYYMGTYNDFTTISVSNYSYLNSGNAEVSQFPVHFTLGGSTTPEQPSDEVTMVTAPVAGTAYKMYLVQAKKGQTLFFNGTTESASVNYRLALVEDKAQAVDVYLEEATGGYRLYFMNGTTKTYIRVYERDAANKKGSLEFVTTAPAEVMTFDSTYNTLKYTSAGGENYYMGTYNDFTTISVSNYSYLNSGNAEVSQFPVHFTLGGSTTPEQPSDKILIDKIADLTAGTYKMAAYLSVGSGNLDLSAAPYHLWDGTIGTNSGNGDLNTNSYSLSGNTLTPAGTDAKADVELVAVAGKANTYYIKVGSQYLYSTEAATNRRLALGTEPAEWVASNNSNGGITLSSNGVYLGSASATYDFLRSYKGESTLKYGVVFFKLEGNNQQPVTPPAGDPEGTVLTIAEAIAKASAMENYAATTTKYTVTGVVDEITSTQWGNMYIKDANGNRLYVYGVYDITGDIRYDAMTTKPVVGDTITLLGVIGNHNGAQMKSGWLQELIPGTGTTPEQPPVNPEQPSDKILIDKIADLTAGTYKMAAYLSVGSGNLDLSAAPYHLWDGTIGTNSGNGDLNTNSYSLSGNTLTPAGTDAKADVELVAVAGKANTYYIKVGSQYLYSTEAATNRRLALGTEPAEWVASNNSNGGITLSSNGVYLGSASATYDFLRSYKGESTLKYGVVFFAAN